MSERVTISWFFVAATVAQAALNYVARSCLKSEVQQSFIPLSPHSWLRHIAVSRRHGRGRGASVVPPRRRMPSGAEQPPKEEPPAEQTASAAQDEGHPQERVMIGRNRGGCRHA